MLLTIINSKANKFYQQLFSSNGRDGAALAGWLAVVVLRGWMGHTGRSWPGRPLGLVPPAVLPIPFLRGSP